MQNILLNSCYYFEHERNLKTCTSYFQICSCNNPLLPSSTWQSAFRLSVVKPKRPIRKKENIFENQWYSKWKQSNYPKRGKTRATDWSVLVLHLIGWENSANSLDRSHCEVRCIQSRITFDTQLKNAVRGQVLYLVRKLVLGPVFVKYCNW